MDNGMTAFGNVSRLEIERTEYGKYCSGRDGPIENGAEHGRLLKTTGFPPQLVAACSPKTLSLADSDAELDREGILTFANPFGTVIRPVRSGGDLSLVAYRVGIRHEAGPKSRVYTLARYLFERTCTASPMTLYRALGRFEGFIRKDSIDTQPWRVDPVAGQVSEDLLAKFLPEALRCVVSGYPIHVRDAEEHFFCLADVLWHHLPLEARRLFSIGWNVGQSLALRLCMSCALVPSPLAMQFDKTVWRNPPRNLDQEPGRNYVNAVNKLGFRNTCEIVMKEFESPTADAEGNVGSSVPVFPDLQDGATSERFREIGRLAFDAVQKAQRSRTGAVHDSASGGNTPPISQDAFPAGYSRKIEPHPKHPVPKETSFVRKLALWLRRFLKRLR
jgi:hypothetical protein